MVSEPLTHAMAASSVSLSSFFSPLTIPYQLVTKLSTDNYLAWRAQVLPLVRGHNLLGHLDGTTPCSALTSLSSDGKTSLDHTDQHNRWICQDQLLLGWLLNSMIEALIPQFISYTISFDLWQDLAHRFSSKTIAKSMELRSQLHNLQKGHLTIQAYFDKITSIIDSLSAIGTVLSTEDIFMHILHGLGPEYDPLVVPVTYGGNILTSEQLLPLLTRFPAITYRVSCPYTPEQNGLAERKHRHVVELGLATLLHAHIPQQYWPSVFESVVFVINRLRASPLFHISPYQKLFDKIPDYSFLRAIGCLCFPLLRPYAPHKLAPRSQPCVFIGYSIIHKGYKCLDLTTNRVYISRHVVFDETIFPFQQSPSLPPAHISSPAPAHSSALTILPSSSLSLILLPSPLLPLPHLLPPLFFPLTLYTTPAVPKNLLSILKLT
jgi:gag-polypeptide of LTR copia-type